MNSTTFLKPRRAALPHVVQPLHANYDHARSAWNLHADQRPDGVVAATTEQQVVDAVAFAREQGLRIAPQGTGHLGAALPDLRGSLLLRTALHDEVLVDPIARRVRVQAGAIWEDVVKAVAPYGLAVMHGSSPDVGVFGYVLGGGLSFYAREHGVTASHVVAMEIVTADGELRRVDADNEPELFWALRGGGGNFGVVTTIELSLLPIAEVYAGASFWPIEHAAALLDEWLAWTREAPETITTAFRLLRLPPVPDVPEPLRGAAVVALDGAATDPAAGEELVARMRAVGAPAIIDEWGMMPADGILRMHGDPEHPTPGIGDTALLGELDAAGAAAFIAANGPDSDSPLLAAELRQLGGALARPDDRGGATNHMPGAYALFLVGVPMAPGAEQAIEAKLAETLTTLKPWSTGRTYLNFAEQGGSAESSFDEETYARLARIRSEYDPDGLFVASHEIA